MAHMMAVGNVAIMIGIIVLKSWLLGEGFVLLYSELY